MMSGTEHPTDQTMNSARDAIVQAVEEWTAGDDQTAMVVLASAALVISRRMGIPDVAAANTLWHVAQANP